MFPTHFNVLAIFTFFLHIYYVYGCFVWMHICVSCEYSAQQGHARALDPLGLELQKL